MSRHRLGFYLAFSTLALSVLLMFVQAYFKVFNSSGAVFAIVVVANAVIFFLAGALQFPFREEESWECNCGYDLSYMNKASSRCPECGAKVSLEWTPNPGEFSRATTKRLHWTCLLMFISFLLFLLVLLPGFLFVIG